MLESLSKPTTGDAGVAMPAATAMLEAAVSAYQPLVLSSALRVTSDFALAEDATQEAFIALYRHAADIRTPEAVGAWLRTAVRRIARDLARRERHPIRRVLADRALDDESMPYPGRRAATTPADALVDRERSAEALALLAALPRGDREVLVGLLFGADSRERLAAYLGISTQALHKRFQRASQRLRAAGHDSDQLAGILGLVSWPHDAAERAKRSATARGATRDALNACSNPVSGMMRIGERAPFERAYALGARALALNPHDARCHAVMTEICLWLAKFDASVQVGSMPVSTAETFTGTLAGAPLEQALAHARLAEQLAPNEPRVLSAVASTLAATAATPAEIPWTTIVELALCAHRVAPDSLEFAAQYVALAMRQAGPVDWSGFERALRRQRRSALERFDLYVITAVIVMCVGLGNEARARWLLQTLKHDLHPNSATEDLYERALATMADRLAHPATLVQPRETGPAKSPVTTQEPSRG